MREHKRHNFTVKFLDSLKVRDGDKRTEFRDSVQRGLGIRVSAAYKSWAFTYTHAGKLYRKTLGEYPALGLAEARVIAAELHARVLKGDNPVGAEQRSAVEASQRAAAMQTIMEFAATYIERYAKIEKRRWKEDEWMLRKHVLPHWSGRKVTEIQRADVTELLERIYDPATQRGIIMANRCRSLLSSVFNFAVQRGVCEHNPVAGSARPKKREAARSFRISDGQVRGVYAAIGSVPNPCTQACLRLLILTGGRLEEIREMRWAEVDFDAALWTLPAERSKPNREWIVPLSPEAIAVLRECKERSDSSEYVLADSAGKLPSRSGVRWSLKYLREVAPGMRIHDTRRIVTTWASSQRAPADVLDALLNHAGRSTTDRHYNNYDARAEHRAILEKWARWLTGKTAEVIDFPSREVAA